MIRELAQGIDGLVTIAYYAPGQVARTVAALPAPERTALAKLIRQKVELGDSEMSKPYYYNVPQLYKLPPVFTKSPGMGADDFDEPVDYNFTVEEVGPVFPNKPKSKSNTAFLVGALVLGYFLFRKK